ncbi:MAG: penicillin acylase family protein, partial [Ardenticatenales bacterium]|nr:penicillin acylase family protein [Ardenticatenales bacterium]
MKKLKIGIALALVVVLSLLAGSWWWVTRAFPQTSGTLTLAGLEGPVEIRRDEWGVPHIYASSLHDLYFAQGVVHAQDRLWQMDFQRRVGLGRLSELLGEPTLKTDKFLRTIGTGAAAQRDWATLSSESKAYLQAYTDGVNAYMATNPTLPLEYQLLQVEWEPWEPAHTLAWGKMMQWDLNGNWDEEILRAQLVEQVGAERMALLMGDGTVSGSTTPISIGSPDLEALADILQMAGLGRSSGAGDRGSNAWVVAGSRTESGRPLLENDPHLGIGMPGIWYEIGLHAPGMDVIGASLPGVVAVVSGHNANIAWGMTNLATDTQDLFIERLDEAGTSYEWQGEMLPLTVRREVIQVKGEEDVVIEVKETRHGPLLNDVVKGLSEPIAFQWRATMTPTRLADAILGVNRASNRDEFIEALRLWDSPAQNLMYADMEGNIGYVATGDIPIRPAAGGLLPQPGWSGEWEWQGMVPFEEQLQSWNPSEGYLLTANEFPFPEDYPYYTGSAWAAPFRANRIRQMLEEDSSLTIDDVQAMQRDVTSLAAPALVPHLLNVVSDDIIVQRAQEQLASWNYVIDGRLPGAGIYEVTHGFVVREMLADELGEELLDEYI